jgi:hypothetical protein
VTGVVEVLAFVGVVAVIAVVGLRLGMLVAPRLDRMTTPDDEDEGGRPD